MESAAKERRERKEATNFGSYKFQIKKYALSQGAPSCLKNGLTCLLLNFFAFFAFFRG